MTDPGAYGRAFADVYDDWYDTISDAEATADFVSSRCRPGPIIELGVGTGRVARPLAERGRIVIGIDASGSMLARCRQRGGPGVLLVRGDLGRLPIIGPVAGAICAFNTLFNLDSLARQEELLRRVATAVGPDGPVIVEAMTGHALGEAPRRSFGITRETAGRTVVAATTIDHETRTIAGRHLDITGQAVVARPWSLRWTPPPELDRLADRAGLVLCERYASWDGNEFKADSQVHISVYRRS